MRQFPRLMPRAMLVCHVVFAALAVTLTAHAADETPEEFLNSLATLDSRYLPSGAAGTGEAIDHYTGSLGFVVTDVSLPGNSDLRVALTRRFRPAFPGKDDGPQAFGDWSFERPVITGIVSREKNQDGWRVADEAHPLNRCSEYTNLPTIHTEWADFEPDEYNAGFRMQIPGEGIKTLLRRDPSNSHSPQMTLNGQTLTFPLVTKDDWMAACIPLGNNLGEGFLVVAPDGRKFWFNSLTYRWVSRISKPADTFPHASDDTDSPQAPQTAWMERERVNLYASRVEDRFGHWVTWSSSRIEADDGRRIDLQFNSNGKVDTVTAQPQSGAPRVWHYSYSSRTFQSQTVYSLSAATLPDSTYWSYDLDAISYTWTLPTSYGCFYPGSGTQGNAISGSVTTPAGMQVSYVVKRTLRGHAATPKLCWYTSFAGEEISKQPVVYTVYAVQRKTASGAGLPSRTWYYDYSPYFASWNYECNPNCPGGDTVWTRITDPEGRVVKYSFSNRFDETEGELKSVEYRDSASGSIVRNETRQYAAADTGPWPEKYGSWVSSRINGYRASTRRPLSTRTTSEGGIHYTWTASAWNTYAQPTHVTRASSGANGDSVSETLAYNNNTSVWVLGRFQSRSVTAPGADAGKVPESRTYHASDATLDTIRRFGHTVATYTWYSSGNAAGQLASVTDGNNHSTTYSNYAYGVPQTIGYADGTSIGLTPNAYGEVLDVTDELGHTTTVQRDDLGRITHKTFPADSGQSWSAVNIAYQRMATSEYGVPGTHWRVTRTQGRNKQVTVYDAALEPVLNYAVDTSSNPDTGHMTWHQYDSAGRATFTSYPLDYAASLPGNIDGVTTDYDVLGRTTGTVADAEAPLYAVTTLTTYTSGNQIDFRDGRGHHTVTTYQAFDSPSYEAPIQVQFASGITTTTVTRDSFGAPTRMQQTGTYAGSPLSVTHTFGYDPYHRLCKQVSPETGTTGYHFDAADNLDWTAQGVSGDPCATNYTLPPNAKISRSYDNRNRLTKIDYPSGTADKHFQYYPDGRLHYATRDAAGSNPASTWTMNWFHRGLLQSETLAIDSHNFALGYDYDSEGHRKSVTYPGIGTIQYAPDGLGRPTQAGSYATDLDYDPGGGLTQLDYGNGIQANWGYNTRKLLDTTIYSLGSDLTNRSLTYDKNGNLKTITDTIHGSNCSTGDTIFCNGFEIATYTGTGNWSYAYDALDRLQHVANPYVPDVFTYDPLGNIRTTSELGTFDYDSHNRIEKRTHGPVFNYLWSDRGTLTTDGERSFTWNRANELTADSQGGSFGYDANGWRLRKSRDGTLEYFVYNHAHQLMLRWNNTTQTETDFVYLGGKALARIEGGTTTYIQPDYHGSPLFETGANGSITRQPFYLGYGRTTAEGRSKIPGYTGAAMDVTTGHTYLGARYLYHKRFTSPDPAWLDPTSPTGLNRYAYGADDPVNQTDSTGRCVDSDFSCGEQGRAIAANPGAFSGAAPYAAAAAGIMAAGPLVGVAIEAAIANPATATAIINGTAETFAGDALGGASLTAGVAGAAKVADEAIPAIKVGSAGGKTAGKVFSATVKDAARAENPGRICVYCRMKGTATQVDHAIPRARGGNATLKNAQMVCPHCNASKGARDFPVNPPQNYFGRWPPSHWKDL